MPSRPFIPVPGVVKVQLIYTLHAQRIENVFNVRSGAGLGSADLDRIQGVFATWWTNTGRLQCTNQLSLTLMVLDALDSVSGLHREYTTGWTAAGGNANQCLTTGQACAIKLATGLRGRSFRGRIYWPGIPTNMITANTGQITAAYRDALAASINTLRTSLTADSAVDTLVVVSYMANGLWRTTGLATTVTSASAHLNLDSMRRRLPGRGL